MLESLQQADQQLLLFLNGIHSPFWDSFMWIFTAKMTWIPMYAAILYVLLKNFRLSVSLITVLAIALTITYADQICATVIRPCVERLRPSNPQNPISELIHLVNGKRGGRYGFPSCHAANSFALAFFVMLLFRERMLTLAILLWAAINSYSRIYIGVHYPGGSPGRCFGRPQWGSHPIRLIPFRFKPSGFRRTTKIQRYRKSPDQTPDTYEIYPAHYLHGIAYRRCYSDLFLVYGNQLNPIFLRSFVRSANHCSVNAPTSAFVTDRLCPCCGKVFPFFNSR